VNEYCYPDRSLDPCPNFEEKLPRCRIDNFLDETGWTQGDWFTTFFNGWKLGETFTFYRGRGECATMKNRPNPPTTAALDVKAIQALSTIRFKQRESLLAELKSASQAVPDSKRMTAITDFFSQSGRQNISKEIITIICDYDFEPPTLNQRLFFRTVMNLLG
jgi:hypothetical protein